MKRLTVVIFLLFTITQIFAQSGVRKGDAQYEQKNYFLAAKLYKQAFPDLKEKEDIMEVAYKIGECYRLVNKYNEANKWYKVSTDKRYKENDIYFKYGMTLMMAADYKLAEKMFKNHLKKNPKDELTKLKIKSCEFVDTVSKKDTPYDFRNLQEINTQYNDFAAVSVKEKVIFTSANFNKDSVVYNYTGTGFEDLYETYVNSETQLFESPVALSGGINSKFNNGTLAFDIKRNLGYFMQCNGMSGTAKNCNIFVSTWDEQTNTWTRGVPFPHKSTKYSSGHPALSPDGNTMYFVSNNPEGFGGTDIWKTTRSEEQDDWSTPENLGPIINTPYNEMFPYIFDDAGFYFSSDGHMGYGGLDIYYVEKQDTTYKTPENLQDPFNSSADDFAISFLNAKSGIFSSNRPGGVGEDDLYYFTFKRIDIAATGFVKDQETGKPIENAIVVLTGKDGLADTVATDKDGKYMFNMLEQDMGYYVISVKDNFLNPDKKWLSTDGINKNVILSSANGYDLDFSLTKIEAGKEYEIKNIYYDLDKYNLRPRSIEELTNIVNVLNNNPDICIQINSHTDTRASDEYNIILSDNRAKSVVDFLISKGIDTKRLTWQGWGETKLAVPNAQTEEEHQANRRTTFTIVNVDELHLGEKANLHSQAVERVKQQEASTVAEPKGEGIYFRIQIAAAKHKCNANTFAKVQKSYSDIETYCTQYPDGFYRYTVGQYLFLEQAQTMKNNIDALGYKSYIVAYKNGERIPIQQAIREINK